MEDQSTSNQHYLTEIMPENPPAVPDPQGGIPPLKPSNWLWQSIVATVLCCIPLGIVGIVYATRVDSNYFAGRYKEADRAAKQAKMWTLIAVAAGLIYIIVWSILFASGLLPDAMQQIIENNVSGYNF